MKKSQYIKQRRIQQRKLEKATCKNLVWHTVIIIIILIIVLYNMPRAVIAEKEDTSRSVEVIKTVAETKYDCNWIEVL